MAEVKQLSAESQELDLKNAGKKRTLSGPMKKMITVIAVVMSIYHLYTAAFGLLMPIQQRSIHLTFVLSLVFLLYPASSRSDKNKPTIVDWLCVALSIAATANISYRFMSSLRGGATSVEYISHPADPVGLNADVQGLILP